MKLFFFYLVSILFIGILQQDSKLDLVCQRWRQVGIKSFHKDYHPLDQSAAEVILIKKDGNYEEEIYSTIKIKGRWKFNIDSSKLAFAMTEMNGTTIEGLSLADTNPTDSIIKLTKDTLIYGALAFYGQQKEYGHDDWYFVREK
jgi:hypothetical protein